MAGANTWVCGNCRSINDTRSTRCYSCRTPRTLAVDVEAVSSASRSNPLGDDAPRSEHARVAQAAGATWTSSDQLAWGVRLAIVVVTVLSLARIAFDIWLLGQDRTPEVEDLVATVDPVAFVVLGAAWLASFAAWGMWLSRVVANVPALGGGWPGTTPTAAFLSAAVPGSNVVWGTAVMRDVLARLSVGGARLGLLTAWWITTILAALPWIGRLPGQFGAVRLGYRLIAGSLAGIATAITGAEVTEEQMVEAMAALLLLGAAGLAIWLIDQVEDLQADRRRELIEAGVLAPPPAP